LAEKKRSWRSRIVGHDEIDPNQLLANPRNWRIHPKVQQDLLEGVLEEVGWIDELIVNKRTNFVVDGHLRAALAISNDEPVVPVLYIDVSEEEELVILATLDPLAAMAVEDTEKVSELLGSIEEVENEFLKQFFDNWKQEGEDFLSGEREKKDRSLPLDYFVTVSQAPICCLAIRFGFKYGRQSANISAKTFGVCEYTRLTPHKLDFIDNNFYEYDHGHHLAIVEHFKPKYATVLDVMNEFDCAKNNMEYHSIDEILDWADEVGEHAENVIVIPKYDCLDEIPEKYILGYSIPTSHGSTPLPLEMFKGRRVHLLGGSWGNQLHALEVLGDDVVSIDNNYLLKQAKFGSFAESSGESKNLNEVIGYVSPFPWYLALSLSFHNISVKLLQMRGMSKDDAYSIEDELLEGRE
jgi:hypothetical protein